MIPVLNSLDIPVLSLMAYTQGAQNLSQCTSLHLQQQSLYRIDVTRKDEECDFIY